MNRSTQKKNAGTHPEKTRTANTPDTRRTWTPQPCGISREDMRQIVLEMIG